MMYLLDSGVLLRLFDRTDPSFPAIRDCVRRLRREPGSLHIAMQNLTEFWNVTTRPATARGGYGVSLSVAEKRLRFLESMCSVLYPSAHSHREWQQLIVTYSVQGVQVHDAHLVAVMQTAGINRIITLNKSDFARYSGILAMTPAELLADWQTGTMPSL